MKMTRMTWFSSLMKMVWRCDARVVPPGGGAGFYPIVWYVFFLRGAAGGTSELLSFRLQRLKVLDWWQKVRKIRRDITLYSYWFLYHLEIAGRTFSQEYYGWSNLRLLYFSLFDCSPIISHFYLCNMFLTTINLINVEKYFLHFEFLPLYTLYLKSQHDEKNYEWYYYEWYYLCYFMKRFTRKAAVPVDKTTPATTATAVGGTQEGPEIQAGSIQNLI